MDVNASNEDPESLEDLNGNFKDFNTLSEIEDKKVRQTEAKAGGLAGVYVICETILYTQETSHNIRKPWVPVCLSASVSIAFFVVFVTAVNDCLRIRRQQDLIFMEQERLHRKIFSIRTGRAQHDGGAAAEQSLADALAFVQFRRYALVGMVHSSLFVYGLLVSYALLPPV